MRENMQVDRLAIADWLFSPKKASSTTILAMGRHFVVAVRSRFKVSAGFWTNLLEMNQRRFGIPRTEEF